MFSGLYILRYMYTGADPVRLTSLLQRRTQTLALTERVLTEGLLHYMIAVYWQTTVISTNTTYIGVGSTMWRSSTIITLYCGK